MSGGVLRLGTARKVLIGEKAAASGGEVAE